MAECIISGRQGPKGDQGPQGQQGPQGATGPQGTANKPTHVYVPEVNNSATYSVPSGYMFIGGNAGYNGGSTAGNLQIVKGPGTASATLYSSLAGYLFKV